MNTGDTVTGDLQCTADLLVDGDLGVGTSSPSGLIEVVSYRDHAVLDQQQTEANAFNYWPQIWQSFTAGVSGFMERIDIEFMGMTDCNNKTMYIHEGEGSGGAVLLTQSIYVPTSGCGIRCWRTYYLDNAVEISAGSKYTIRISGAGCATPGTNWSF